MLSEAIELMDEFILCMVISPRRLLSPPPNYYCFLGL